MDYWRQSHSEPSCDIHHLYTVLGMRLVMAMYICHEDIHSTSWHGSKDIALHATHYSRSDASTVPLSSECRWTNKHYKVLIILSESDSCKIKHIQKMKSLSTTTTLTKSNLLHRSYKATFMRLKPHSLSHSLCHEVLRSANLCEKEAMSHVTMITGTAG